MITMRRLEGINEALENLVKEISVTDAKYEEAINSYEAVGEWLSKDDSDIAKYEPQIYPQGSFALGTAIEPINGNDYDVDAVCLLQLGNQDVTQKELKDLVGTRLKVNETYKNMLNPKEGSRRCWTLKYADSRNFHIDILPAIPEISISFNSQTYRNEIDKHKIQITDNTAQDYTCYSNNWHKSNPQGYVNWFKKEMEEKIQTRNSYKRINCSESVEDLPIYKRKTTLQKVIQLLKRHRDLYYGNNEYKPISIIITTLATQAYDGEDNIFEALQNIVCNMDKFIEKRENVDWVENPTNSEENFADKWEKEPDKAIIFHEWLGKLKNVVSDLLNVNKDFSESLQNAYNREDIKNNSISLRTPTQYVTNPIFNVPYREKARWVMQPTYNAKLTATFKPNPNGDRIETYYNNGSLLPKSGSLQFKLKTDVPKPYEIELQVVNTGNEAAIAKDLRGKFFESIYIDSDTHRETTRYTGKHMIQALIIKNGVCVAKSEEFIVNIK